MALLTMDVSGLENVQFGEDIRQKEFRLHPNTTFLNIGSFGIVPQRVLEMKKRYLDMMESDPDDFIWNRAPAMYKEAVRAVAEFVGAEEEDVVFVVNATMGVNTILRSLPLQPGDAVMATSLTFASLQQLWKDVEGGSFCPKGVKGLLMEVKLPIVSEDALVQQYDDFLTQHPHVKFVLIDHITSPSAIVMPVTRLAAVCRQHGAMVMVDGAHAPGQLPLNLRQLDVDFYTGNMHKWGYTPRGCAFLWVRRQYHSLVRPLQTSWRRGKSLTEQFLEQGTRDYTSFICAKHALQFFQAIGGMEKVVSYTSGLATQGRDLLVKEVGLERLDIPPSMEAPNLRVLKLPGIPSDCLGLDNATQVVKVRNKVFQEGGVRCYVAWLGGALCLRFSTQVCNTLDDFRKFVPALKRIRDSCVPYES